MQLESVTVKKWGKIRIHLGKLNSNNKYARTFLVKCYAGTGNNYSEASMCCKSSPPWKNRGPIGENTKVGNYLPLNYTLWAS